MVDNLSNDVYESKVEEFKAVYGIDPGSAQILFRDRTLMTMLEHMYLDSMEDLRECRFDEDGRHCQGQAQALWCLLNVPKVLECLNELMN